MGKRYQSDCVQCGLPCIGSGCDHYETPTYFCDECGAEVDPRELYIFDGMELCKGCLLQNVDTVR